MEYDTSNILTSKRFGISFGVTVEDIEAWTPPIYRGFAEPSYAIICPLCGSLWCRFLALNYDTEKGAKHEVTWRGETAVCRDCGNGSLLQLYALTHQFPLGQALTIREIELALAYHHRMKDAT